MNNYDNLKSMTLEQLRKLAISQGMTYHHRTKEPALIKQIIEHVTQPPVQIKTDVMQHPAQKPQEAPKMHTEEEVRDVCKQFMAREAFKARFTGETWHFKCNGAEDSGHMSVPLRVIRMKAETVSRGARKMVTVKNADGHDVMMAGV